MARYHESSDVDKREGRLKKKMKQIKIWRHDVRLEESEIDRIIRQYER